VRLDSSVALAGLIGSALIFLACRRRVMAYCASADQSADCKKAVGDAWGSTLPLVVIGALCWLTVSMNSAFPMEIWLGELIWTIVWILLEVHFSMVMKAW